MLIGNSTHRSDVQRIGGWCEAGTGANVEWPWESRSEPILEYQSCSSQAGNATVIRAQGITRSTQRTWLSASLLAANEGGTTGAF